MVDGLDLFNLDDPVVNLLLCVHQHTVAVVLGLLQNLQTGFETSVIMA